LDASYIWLGNVEADEIFIHCTGMNYKEKIINLLNGRIKGNMNDEGGKRMMQMEIFT
jgi:hypothetical protein